MNKPISTSCFGNIKKLNYELIAERPSFIANNQFYDNGELQFKIYCRKKGYDVCSMLVADYDLKKRSLASIKKSYSDTEFFCIVRKYAKTATVYYVEVKNA